MHSINLTHYTFGEFRAASGTIVVVLSLVLIPTNVFGEP